MNNKKHVFFVFSHITFYIAKSIQSYLGLEEEQVLYLTGRNYQNYYHQLNTISFDQEYKKLYKLNEKNFFKGWPVISRIDEKIDFYISEEYCLYIPHLRNPLFQIIASNRKCREIHFIEEGSLAYLKQPYIEPKEKIIKYLRRLIVFIFNHFKLYGLGRYYKISHFEIDFFKKSSVHLFFTISDYGFKYIRHHKVIKLPFYKDEEILLSHINLSYPILIFDAWRNLNDYSILELAFKTLNSKLLLNRFNIKFHPEQNKEQRKRLIILLNQNNIDFNIIPDEIPLEQIFIKTSNHTIIGFMSSLLNYADMMGHKVISLGKFYKLDAAYRNSQFGRGRETIMPKSDNWIELLPED